MTSADELLAIDRSGDLAPYPGMELTEAQRAALVIDERFAAGPATPEASPDVRVLVYRPRTAVGARPLILSIHGGAFVRMRADTFVGMDASMALDANAVVVSVDYRLAPEHPFPAAPEDCYAVLLWAVEQASSLGIDASRIAVTGGSAGGALAAAVTLMARDRGGPPIAFQALNIPVLDDRLDTPSMAQAEGAPGFNSANSRGMWLHYLGASYDRSATSPYAAPARAASLAGLPPAVILTNGRDPLRDEGLLYALRLLADGVDVEIHNVPGAYHGAPPLDASAAARGAAVFRAAIVDALR